jgi:hypothetical protein
MWILMWIWKRTKIDQQLHLHMLCIVQRTSIHRIRCWCQVKWSQIGRHSFHRRSSFFFVKSPQILTNPSVKDRSWFVIACMYWIITILVTPTTRSSNILNKCVPRVLWSLFSACLSIYNSAMSFIHLFISFHSFLQYAWSRYPGLGQTTYKPGNALGFQLLESACDRLTCFRGRGCTFS